jgi:hypothetical protein
MQRRWARALGAGSAAIAMIVIVTMLAMAPAVAHTRTVVARGPCTGDSHWRIELVKDAGRISIQFKVVQGAVGDVWGTGIAHNRHVLFRALLATHGDDGSFAVRVWTRNTDGPDFFRARARNLATDEICRGRAVI